MSSSPPGEPGEDASSAEPGAPLLDGLLEAAEASRRDADQTHEGRAFQIIRFRSGDRDFAVPIDCVERTERVPMMTPVPRSPTFIRGVAGLRGGVVCILDLQSFLTGERGTGLGDARSLLVINQGTRRVAVLSESLPDFERVGEEETMSIPTTDVEIYSGAVERESELVGIIDPAKLFDLIERRLSNAL